MSYTWLDTQALLQTQAFFLFFRMNSPGSLYAVLAWRLWLPKGWHPAQAEQEESEARSVTHCAQCLCLWLANESELPRYTNALTQVASVGVLTDGHNYYSIASLHACHTSRTHAPTCPAQGFRKSQLSPCSVPEALQKSDPHTPRASAVSTMSHAHVHALWPPWPYTNSRMPMHAPAGAVAWRGSLCTPPCPCFQAHACPEAHVSTKAHACPMP